jgi:hypothetical protein
LEKTSSSVYGGGDPYEADEPVRNIFREHGWPDDYRKEDCMKKLMEWKRKEDEAK